MIKKVASTIIAISFVACISQNIFTREIHEVFITRDINSYLDIKNSQKRNLELELKNKAAKYRNKRTELVQEIQKLKSAVPKLEIRHDFNEKEKIKAMQAADALIDAVSGDLTPKTFKIIHKVLGKGVKTIFGDVPFLSVINELAEVGKKVIQMEEMKKLIKEPTEKYKYAKSAHSTAEKAEIQEEFNQFKIANNKMTIDQMDREFKTYQATTFARLKEIDAAIEKVEKEGRYDVDKQVAANRKKKDIVKSKLKEAAGKAKSNNLKLKIEIGALEKSVGQYEVKIAKLRAQIADLWSKVLTESARILEKAKQYQQDEIGMGAGKTTLAIGQSIAEIVEAVPVVGTVAKFFKWLFGIGGKVLAKVQKDNRKRLNKWLVALYDQVDPILALITKLHKTEGDLYEAQFTIEKLKLQLQKSKKEVKRLFRWFFEIYGEIKQGLDLRKKLTRKQLGIISRVQKGYAHTEQQRKVRAKIVDINTQKKALDAEIRILRRMYD